MGSPVIGALQQYRRRPAEKAEPEAHDALVLAQQLNPLAPQKTPEGAPEVGLVYRPHTVADLSDRQPVLQLFLRHVPQDGDNPALYGSDPSTHLKTPPER